MHKKFLWTSTALAVLSLSAQLLGSTEALSMEDEARDWTTTIICPVKPGWWEIELKGNLRNGGKSRSKSGLIKAFPNEGPTVDNPEEFLLLSQEGYYPNTKPIYTLYFELRLKTTVGKILFTTTENLFDTHSETIEFDTPELPYDAPKTLTKQGFKLVFRPGWDLKELSKTY